MPFYPAVVAATAGIVLSSLVAQGSGVRVAEHGDEVHAAGPDYRARFDAGGVEFETVGGGPGVGAASLHFTFLAAMRGGIPIATASSVVPTASERSVQYARGTVVERYDARADGIEQSFVFAERPAGAGDLIVRGRITTALPLAAAATDGVRYARPDGIGIGFGAVTGIDANGRTMAGALRVDGDVLELSLPAAFVAAASYPLVLDPLVGAVFSVGNEPGVLDTHPVAAFHPTTQRYLVVWAVRVGGAPATSEIRAQFVQAGGAPTGPQLVLTADAEPDAEPAVAFVRASARFVVAWTGSVGSGRGIVACTVSSAGGIGPRQIVVSSSLTVTVGRRLALGGDMRSPLTGGLDALLVYTASSSFTSSNSVASRILSVQGSSVGIGATATLASSSNELGEVAVSPHLGSATTGARWLAVFAQRTTAGAGPFHRLYGQLVEANGSLCGTPETIVNPGAAGDVSEPTVARRTSSSFAVAWTNGITDAIEVRPFTTGPCGFNWSFGATVTPVEQAGAANSPALAFAGERYVLAWQQDVLGWRVYSKGLDLSCVACGAEERVAAGTVADGLPFVATQYDSGESSEDALVGLCLSGGISARHWTAHGTPGITNLGGGCGGTGLSDVATYNGLPRLGESGFEVAIAGPSSPVLALAVGFSAAPLPCGACTLVPSLDVLLPTASPVPIPIPCAPGLIGTELLTQWILLRPSGCPLLPDLGLSNALRFTIAE